jgi:hypothetical protein
MNNSETSNKPRRALRIIALLVIGLLIVPVVLMNLTPGHFGFPDDDGCACFVAYTTHPSQPACEQTRARMCDALWSQEVLAYLSRLDFNK